LKGTVKPLDFIKDLLGIRLGEKKGRKGDFSLPIKSIGDLLEGKDGTYKLVLKVSPVNGELLSEGSLDMVSSAIQGGLATFSGRIGIYIQSESVNVGTNISNIEKFKASLNSEVKLVLLEEQKKHIQSMVGRSRNVLNFYTVFEVKEASSTSADELLGDTYLSFKSELESQGMYVDRLAGSDIKALLYKRMNPESSEVECLREDWEIGNILPENARIYKDGRHLDRE